MTSRVPPINHSVSELRILQFQEPDEQQAILSRVKGNLTQHLALLPALDQAEILKSVAEQIRVHEKKRLFPHQIENFIQCLIDQKWEGMMWGHSIEIILSSCDIEYSAFFKKHFVKLTGTLFFETLQTFLSFYLRELEKRNSLPLLFELLKKLKNVFGKLTPPEVGPLTAIRNFERSLLLTYSSQMTRDFVPLLGTTEDDFVDLKIDEALSRLKFATLQKHVAQMQVLLQFFKKPATRIAETVKVDANAPICILEAACAVEDVEMIELCLKLVKREELGRRPDLKMGVLLREEGKGDVSLSVQREKLFIGHSVLLSARSDWFRKHLENKPEALDIQGVPADEMYFVLKIFYNGCAEIQKETLPKLLEWEKKHHLYFIRGQLTEWIRDHLSEFASFEEMRALFLELKGYEYVELLPLLMEHICEKWVVHPTVHFATALAFVQENDRSLQCLKIEFSESSLQAPPPLANHYGALQRVIVRDGENTATRDIESLLQHFVQKVVLTHLELHGNFQFLTETAQTIGNWVLLNGLVLNGKGFLNELLKALLMGHARLRTLRLQNCSFNGETLVSFLEKKGSALEMFEISSCTLSQLDSSQQQRLNDLDLGCLYALNVSNTSGIDVEKLLRRCRYLTKLDLRGIPLNDALWKQITQFQNLTHFSFSDCKQQHLESLQHLRKLAQIDLSPYPTLSTESVAEACNARNSLKELNLSYHLNISDQNLIQILRTCPQLTILKVNQCKALTNSAFLALSFYCPQLEVLEASETGIRREGIKALAHSCYGLTRLVVDHCDLSDQSPTQALNKKEASSCLIRDTSIRELSCKNCKGISDEERKSLETYPSNALKTLTL